MKKALVAIAAVVLASCGGASFGPKAVSRGSGTEPDPKRLEVPLDSHDGVHVFTSIPWGFDTNSFWIEGPSGVVVIDTQFLPSEAERAIALIEHETQKRVSLAIVLHPNPDKFNGSDVFRKHGARVLSSAQVLAEIPAVAEQRRRAFYDRYAPDYPAQDPTLESFGSKDTTLHEAGLDIDLHVLGRGCSETHVVAAWKGHVFTGDLVASGTHSWLELGHVREWLRRLDDIEAMKPRRVHPGRGPSGNADLVGAERAYLQHVLDVVDARKPTNPAPVGAIEGMREEIERAYPSLRYPVFLYGLSAVWSAEAARASHE